MRQRIYWWNFLAFVLVGIFALVIIGDELLGIAHVWGLNPITEDAEHDPRLFWAILAAGPLFVAWWIVHIRNHRY